MSIASDTARALADRSDEIAIAILGKPISITRREMRWGSRGSVSLCRDGAKRGHWFDHERGQGGDLLHLLARERGVDLGEAIRIAQRDYLGGGGSSAQIPSLKLRDDQHAQHCASSYAARTATEPVQKLRNVAQFRSSTPVDDADRIAAALRMWRVTTALSSTLGEHYFVEHRRLDVRPLELDHALRWHAGQRCIVALMTDAITGEPTGIHRTYLDPAGAKVCRKMLGRKGVMRLSPDDEVTLGLGIVEGVEDGLAVLLSGWAPVWAAANSGAMTTFPVLAGVECLTLFADADSAGMNAAQHCSARWIEVGKEACISPPVRMHDVG